MSPDQLLMSKIKTAFGDVIDAAIVGTEYTGTLDKSSWGAAMIAALIGNESGGDIKVQRFEPKVLADLVFVAIGRRSSFGSMTSTKIRTAIGAAPAPLPWVVLDTALQRLVNFATSWGPMQIMGYQALANDYDVAELQGGDGTYFRHAVAMLEAFRKQFNISPTSDAAALFFHCWNAGSPTAPTFDPQYTARGLERMAIYAAL
jgi:hypothetical protein